MNAGAYPRPKGALTYRVVCALGYGSLGSECGHCGVLASGVPSARWTGAELPQATLRLRLHTELGNGSFVDDAVMVEQSASLVDVASNRLSRDTIHSLSVKWVRADRGGLVGIATGTTEERMRTWLRRTYVAVPAALLVLTPGLLRAQGISRWSELGSWLATLLRGSIARGLPLIMIVVGGLMLTVGEGGIKRRPVIILVTGMAMGAVSWFF